MLLLMPSHGINCAAFTGTPARPGPNPSPQRDQHLLVEGQPDWTSVNWTQLFRCSFWQDWPSQHCGHTDLRVRATEILHGAGPDAIPSVREGALPMGSGTFSEGESEVISKAVPGSAKILPDCSWAGRPSDERLTSTELRGKRYEEAEIKGQGAPSASYHSSNIAGTNRDMGRQTDVLC